MIVVCSGCATRLQLDDSKLPNRAFTTKCPKCQAVISVTAPNGEADRNGAAVHSSDNFRSRIPTPAPPFRHGSESEPEKPVSIQPAAGGSEMADLGLLLAKLLQGNLPGK